MHLRQVYVPVFEYTFNDTSHLTCIVIQLLIMPLISQSITHSSLLPNDNILIAYLQLKSVQTPLRFKSLLNLNQLRDIYIQTKTERDFKTSFKRQQRAGSITHNIVTVCLEVGWRLILDTGHLASNSKMFSLVGKCVLNKLSGSLDA